jgi:hypothetical protein
VRTNFYLILQSMRIVPNKIYTAVLLVLISALSLAAPTNPPSPPVPVVPPGTSIDGYIIAALFLGSIIVLRTLRIKKRLV